MAELPPNNGNDNKNLEEIQDLSRQREEVRDASDDLESGGQPSRKNPEADANKATEASVIRELQEAVTGDENSEEIEQKLDLLAQMSSGEIPGDPDLIDELLYFLDDYEAGLSESRVDRRVEDIDMVELRAKVEDARQKIETVLEKEEKIAETTDDESTSETMEAVSEVQDFLGGGKELSATEYLESKEKLSQTRETLVAKLERKFGGSEATDQIALDYDTKELIRAIDEAEAALNDLYYKLPSTPTLDEKRVPEWREELIRWQERMSSEKAVAGTTPEGPDPESPTDPETIPEEPVPGEPLSEIDKILSHEFQGLVGDYRRWAEKIAEDRATSEVREMHDRRDDERGLWGTVKFAARRFGLRFYAEARRQQLKYRYIDEIRDKVNDGDDETIAKLKAARETYLVEATEEIIPSEGGEVSEELNSRVKALVLSYARDEISVEDFEEQRQAIVDQLSEGNRDIFLSSEFRTDNLMELAERLKAISKHEEALQRFDREFVLRVDSIRTGMKTEAQRTMVDRTIMWMQRTPGFRLITPESAAIVLGVIYASSNEVSRRIASSKLAAVTTFGATALLAGLYGAARAKTELDTDRYLHAVEMATGGIVREGSRKREKLEEYRVEVISATATTDRIKVLTSRESLTDEEMRELTELVADTTARTRIGDTTSTDLIGYSSYEKVDQEKNDLSRALAQGRATLRVRAEEMGVSLDDILSAKTDELDIRLHSELDEKDTGYGGHRTRYVLGRTAMAAGTALIGVGLASVARGVGENFEVDDGISERIVGPIGAIRRWITGEQEMVDTDGYNVEKIGEYASMRLPKGIDLIQGTDGTYSLLNTADNEMITEGIIIGGDGTISAQSQDVLEGLGIQVSEAHRQISEIIGETKEVTAQDIIDGKVPEASGFFERVYRTFWYDNNTPRKFDLNELKLWWGGQGNTGLTEDGDYVFNIAHMTQGGSFHGASSVDYAEELAAGNMRLNLSLTEGTQRHVFSVPFDSEGNAVVDNDSVVGKLLFDTENGRADFDGRFAEVAQVVGQKNGSDIVRILATYEGEGVDGGTIDTTREIFHDFTDSEIEIPRGWDWSFPPLIPIWGRRPLERLSSDPEIRYLGPNYFTTNPERESRWVEEISPRLLANPEAVLDQNQEIVDYLRKKYTKKGREYQSEVEGIAIRENIVRPETRIVVCMPVAAEGESENIYDTLSLYAAQDGERSQQASILLNVNWVEGRKTELTQRTIEEIERAKADFPQLKITFFTHEWPAELIQKKKDAGTGIYGEVVGLLNDVALESIRQSGVKQEVYLLTNDADSRGMSTRYLESMFRAIDDHQQQDAILGRLEWGTEQYEDFPGYHVSIRFMQMLETFYRNAPISKRNVSSSGANFLVKSGSFAAVGGYNTEIGAGADTDMGWKLKYARFGRKKSIKRSRYPIAYSNAAWIDTDPARGLRDYTDGQPIVEMWSGFDAGAEGYRPRGSMPNGAENLERDFDEIVRRIEDQMTYTVLVYAGNRKKGEIDPEEAGIIEGVLGLAFPKQEGKPCVVYTDDGAIEFTETGRRYLREKLSEFRDQGKKDTKYNNGHGVRAGYVVPRESTTAENQQSPEPSGPAPLEPRTEDTPTTEEPMTSPEPQTSEESPESEDNPEQTDEYPTLSEAVAASGLQVGDRLTFTNLAGERTITGIDTQRNTMIVDPPLPDASGLMIKSSITIDNVLRRKKYDGNAIIQRYLSRPGGSVV